MATKKLLQDKIILITGGGSGIHLELAKLSAANGAKVVIADITLTSEAEAIISTSIIYVNCDVANWKDIQHAIDEATRQFGHAPDVYVAGAGVFEPSWSNFWDDTETDAYQAVQINVNHPMKLTRLATRALVSSGKNGVVCIMASIAGYSGNFAAPLYSATKHALIGFTRSMDELDTIAGVRVVAICPGIVKTPLWTSNPENVARFGYSDDFAVSSIAVAEAELKLITDATFKSGTVYEISLAGERVVPAWNINPPGFDPENPLKGAEVPREALEHSWGPIKVAIARDRESV